jgi:hypothetical protein
MVQIRECGDLKKLIGRLLYLYIEHGTSAKDIRNIYVFLPHIGEFKSFRFTVSSDMKNIEQIGQSSKSRSIPR